MRSDILNLVDFSGFYFHLFSGMPLSMKFCFQLFKVNVVVRSSMFVLVKARIGRMYFVFFSVCCFLPFLQAMLKQYGIVITSVVDLWL